MKKWFPIIALMLVFLPLQGREREPWLDELDAELAKKAEYDGGKSPGSGSCVAGSVLRWTTGNATG